MVSITLLGTGSSPGVPMIGCSCAVCRSSHAKNKRSRASAWIRSGTTSIVIDSSPDLRQQALAASITHIDAVLYTHAHADHIHGIDELRSFNYLSKQPLPIYANADTLTTLQERFAYCFLPPTPYWSRPCLVPHGIDATTPFTIGDMTIVPILGLHGTHPSLGFRIGNMAYCTDVNHFTEEGWERLQGIDIWIIDCLRLDPSPTHAHLDLTLAWIEQLKPKRAVLTHMSHVFDYEQLQRDLPAGIEPGFDGMVIEA